MFSFSMQSGTFNSLICYVCEELNLANEQTHVDNISTVRPNV